MIRLSKMQAKDVLFQDRYFVEAKEVKNYLMCGCRIPKFLSVKDNLLDQICSISKTGCLKQNLRKV